MPILNKTSEGQNMTKPYIVCHMMMSIDGRIDCGMTSKLRGVDEYYATLDALDAPSRVSGRVTAELEMADGPWTATVDGLPADREPIQLKLKHVESYDDGAVWLRYDVIK